MSLAQLFFRGETVYLKKMGLPVTVVDFHRGSPNRYAVSFSGTKIIVSEKQLARTPRVLKFGRLRRYSKFKPGDIVKTKDEKMAVVLSSHKYRKGFRYKLATPSKSIVLDEEEIYLKTGIRVSQEDASSS